MSAAELGRGCIVFKLQCNMDWMKVGRLTLRRHGVSLAVLWEEGLRRRRESALRPLSRRVTIELPGRGPVFAPATLQGSPVDVVTAKLTDGHRRVLVGIHLDEGKATVRVKARLSDITEVLEQWHQIVLRRVRSEVTNVTGSLPLWRLLHNHLV